MPDVAAALSGLEPALGALEGEPVALVGGITNRNFRARMGGRDVVVRLLEPGTDVLGIDRATEVEASTRAAALGIGPELLLSTDGVMVFEFLAGGPASVTPAVAADLRSFHGSPPLRGSFDVFRVIERHADLTDSHRFDPLLQRIESVVGEDRAPCHNDLLPSNFVSDGTRTRIVDWEYAGQNNPFFDLGNLAVNNDFGQDEEQELLALYFDEPCNAARLARLKLMRIVSDAREWMWALVQTQISSLDNDYESYANSCLLRQTSSASDPRVAPWISDAEA
jgi:hypothetical protein